MKALCIIEGILLFIIGILFFTKPIGSLMTVTTLAGIIFVVYAIVKFIRLWNKPNKVLHIFMSIIDGLFGLILIFYPITSIANLIIIYGIWALIKGIYSLIYSSKLGNGYSIFYSILLIIMGLIITFCPIVVIAILPVIPFIIGAYFVITAIVEVFIGFKLHNV